MLDYGTQIVAGTSPNKGGSVIYDVPVFNTMKEAVDATNADTSIVFVPAQYASNAILESLNARILLTCVITEFVPILDMVTLTEMAHNMGLHIVGPNCPGLMVPGQIKLGIMPGICAVMEISESFRKVGHYLMRLQMPYVKRVMGFQILLESEEILLEEPR